MSAEWLGSLMSAEWLGVLSGTNARFLIVRPADDTADGSHGDGAQRGDVTVTVAMERDCERGECSLRRHVAHELANIAAHADVYDIERRGEDAGYGGTCTHCTQRCSGATASARTFAAR